ncbi:MAG: HAD family hydrolase [Micrococcales bacterium]|nr:HAD family hydrolase [Micrococcales bacterium]
MSRPTSWPAPVSGGAFEALVTKDTLGFGKPDGRVFRHACGLLGRDPGDVVYVGDELDFDAIGARDAGLVGVWLDRRGRWDGTDIGVPVIGSLDEVDALL